ncbi:unnamed protein product [Mycena citricolor]|uniref:NAD(P)-binding protein n=1 Tax=Mycena citricolor TaxID=2018698 RepID=A0AAD2HEG7_9AGAR|nr:unnamed protein product [Mycena citricolor]CAK5283711.1 unnamed protein product [Mycena citricolor]
MSTTIRSVFITGANQGLGYNTVHQLAQTPNMVLFMGARRMAAAEEAITQLTPDIHPTSRVFPVYIDLANEKSIPEAKETVAAKLKELNVPGLDFLINNAANSEGPDILVLTINIASTIAIKDTFYPLLNKGGEIINISSDLGSQALHAARPPIRPPPKLKTYCATKAAMNNLTLQWAFEEEEKGTGIRVVAICPGLNATSMAHFMAIGMHPSEGCKVMVKEVLTPSGKSGVFFNKDGPLPW